MQFGVTENTPVLKVIAYNDVSEIETPEIQSRFSPETTPTLDIEALNSVSQLTSIQALIF